LISSVSINISRQKMSPADRTHSALQTDVGRSSSPVTLKQEEHSSDIEVINEAGLYRFVEREASGSPSGSKEESPRPSLQSAAELYSRSLNDVSSLMNERTAKDNDSQVS
jgi:hypothetical protein